ncbi:MAG: pilus assembly protein [Deltaproteobacteria bacterium]|nr:pilus assembly protein [Deltaproteobacteria bacterium]MBW2253555.1 pilus assembly protein [Deltaproteobacteria bacterium]
MVLPFLLVMVTGVMEFGWYISQAIVVSRAARDASRYGASVYERPELTPGSVALPEAEAFALTILEGANRPCNEGCVVQASLDFEPFETIVVHISVPYEPLIGMVTLGTTIEYRFATAVEVQ